MKETKNSLESTCLLYWTILWTLFEKCPHRLTHHQSRHCFKPESNISHRAYFPAQHHLLLMRNIRWPYYVSRAKQW